MALNTNIALGVQPIQQPNMLAQYGQMMALKAAQQETQGNEALRAAYASGGDLSDPEFRRKVMAANPQLGSKLVNQFSEMSARDVKTQSESLKAIKDSIGLVNSPAEMIDFLKGAYSTPGGALLTKLAPFDKAVANIPQDPKSFEEYKRKFSLSADKLFTSAADELSAKTRIQAANISAGPGYERNRMQREKDEYERANPTLSKVDGENGFYLYNPRDPNSAVPLGMRPPAAAPVAQPSAVNNLMMTTQPTPSVNALTQPAPNQPGAPTVANANALNQQPIIIRPKQPLRQPALTEVDDPATPGQKLRVDANVYQQGTTLGAPGVFGVARTEKLTPAQQQKLKGEISKDFEAVERVVGQTNELLESIDAVRSSNLEKVAGPVDARTPSFFTEAQVAESRFNNLKGKVTAIAKANASLGGAIGSIANQEWQILANQIAVLDLAGGKTANLEQIEQLERQAMSIVARMRDGFERQYGADVETLAPQYKDVPNVNYKPGQYTKTGKIKSGVDNDNPLLK
jgi:hypothetical protein